MEGVKSIPGNQICPKCKKETLVTEPLGNGQENVRCPNLRCGYSTVTKNDKQREMRLLSVVSEGKAPSISAKDRLKLYDLLSELDVSTTAKVIWAALVKHVRADRACYPGLQYLCELTNLSASTIRRAIKELKDKRLLSVTHRGNRDMRYRKGGRSSNRYILNPSACGKWREGK